MKTNKTEKVKEREQLAKQKQHLVKEVNSTYTFRKLIIFIAPIFGVICAGYLLFGILGDMGIHGWGGLAFVHDGNLTVYGIIGMVIIGLSIVCSVISWICLFTMHSPRRITEDVKKLGRSVK